MARCVIFYLCLKVTFILFLHFADFVAPQSLCLRTPERSRKLSGSRLGRHLLTGLEQLIFTYRAFKVLFKFTRQCPLGTGAPVVALHMKQKRANRKINRIASIYGKERGIGTTFANWVEQGKLRYFDKEIGIGSLQDSAALQLRMEAASQDPKQSILTPEDAFNKPLVLTF